MDEEKHHNRLNLMVSDRLLKRIEDFQFERRHKTQQVALRELLEIAGSSNKMTNLPKSDIEIYGEECLMYEPGASITALSLYDNYCEWCETTGRSPFGLPIFSRQLTDLGVQKAKIAGKIRYIGIRIHGRNNTVIDVESEPVNDVVPYTPKTPLEEFIDQSRTELDQLKGNTTPATSDGSNLQSVVSRIDEYITALWHFVQAGDDLSASLENLQNDGAVQIIINLVGIKKFGESDVVRLIEYLKLSMVLHNASTENLDGMSNDLVELLSKVTKMKGKK